MTLKIIVAGEYLTSATRIRESLVDNYFHRYCSYWPHLIHYEKLAAQNPKQRLKMGL